MARKEGQLFEKSKCQEALKLFTEKARFQNHA